ncbi:MAG: hypothetical protein ACRDKS_09260, partial [Actinomycetota bacterium]
TRRRGCDRRAVPRARPAPGIGPGIGPGMSQRAQRAAALVVVFGGLVGLYAATFSFRAITDTRLNSLQTRALVEHGDIDLSRYAEAEGYVRPDLVARQVVPQSDGALFSIYGVGVSAAAAPIYAPLVRLDASEAFLQGAVGVLYAAGAVVVLYRTMLTVTPRAIAAAAAAVFAFGTTMWTVASMAFFPQAPMVFFECLGLAGLFSRRAWAPALGGSVSARRRSSGRRPPYRWSWSALSTSGAIARRPPGMCSARSGRSSRSSSTTRSSGEA